GVKVALVGAVAAGSLVLSTGNAFADGLGGDAYTANCHAWVNADGAHYGYGIVDGLSGCMVNLWQYNVITRGSVGTGFYYDHTYSKYHADGVHYLQVEIWDPYTGVNSWGSLVY
ncbi:hypothetical protein ACFQ1S_46820, partial [Kibdelosporangium lantanae]